MVVVRVGMAAKVVALVAVLCVERCGSAADAANLILVGGALSHHSFDVHLPRDDVV